MGKFYSFIIAIFTALALTVACVSNVKVEAEGYTFKDGYSVDVDFSFDLFENSTKFNKKLAITSLEIAMAAKYGGEDFQAFATYLGFENAESYNYDVNNYNAPAFNFASKEYDGKYYIMVCVRATHNMSDIITDVFGGGLNGFVAAGNSVYQELEYYIKNYYPEANITNLVFYISGHSLGGACSGQLAKMIYRNGLALDSNIYAYTFASPRYDAEGEIPEYFPFLFNVVVDQDIISKIPFNYGRIGTDIKYNDQKEYYTTFEYFTILIFIERGLDVSQITLSHHQTKNYYEVLINDEYDGRSNFEKFIDSFVRTMIDVVERIILWS